MVAKKGRRDRRIVDALDDLTVQLRVANLLGVLRAGSSIEHDKGTRATSPVAVARVKFRNEIRAEIREALGLGEVARHGDRG